MKPKFTGEKMFPLEGSSKLYRNINGQSFMKENRAPVNGISKNKVMDISQDIEEMGNCTRRMSRMVRVDSTKMIPSQARRAIHKPEEEIEHELKELLSEGALEERFKIVRNTFNKVITTDPKFGRVLKMIKRVYDEKLEYESQKYNKLMFGLKNGNKCQVSDIPTISQNSTGTEEASILPKSIVVSPLRVLSKSGTESRVLKKSHSIIIPKLNLSKVNPNFPNNKVIYIKAKPKHSNSDYDEDTEQCDSIQ